MRPLIFPEAAFMIPLLALVACGSSDDPEGGDTPPGGPWESGVVLPRGNPDSGDPENGKRLLLNGSYMSCGVPLKLWNDPNLGATAKGALGGGEGERLPSGREGANVDLPYYLNAFTTADGADVVNRNCLTCHGGRFDGKLMPGLGNPAADFTADLSQSAPAPLPDSVLDALGLTAAEKSNLNKVLRFATALGTTMTMRTVGQNPAEQLTGALLARHDKDTLAWLDTPVYETAKPNDADGNPIEDARLVSDPPPWWRAHKKNALFYNGMARGDHRGTMALATAICVDSVAEAERVDGLFKDMHAYVLTLRAPLYVRDIDTALAAQGKDVFQKTCAGCHGTYDADATNDEADHYPNLLLPLDVIGTDTAVADVPILNQQLTDWYNDSFYGKITPAAPSDPFPGYVAPPLDGIWATAPFLHNGSVPTVELVLNSAARPKYWKRADLDDTNFDENALGWPFEEVSYSQADAPEAERKMIYDTTYWSQGNGGHTFGDHLTQAERRAVIEYLKTL